MVGGGYQLAEVGYYCAWDSDDDVYVVDVKGAFRMIKTFSDSLKDNLDPVIERINKGFSSAIIIEGGLGQGKTTLAVQVVDYVNSKFGQPEMSLDTQEQIATGGEEFKVKLVQCYRDGLHGLIYDESGDFSGRRYISAYNRDLYRMFQIYRAFKVLVVIVLPSFTDLDAGLFKLDVVRFGLRLSDRNDWRGVFSGFSLKKMIYARHNIKKGKVVPAFCLRNMSPNFVGIFKNVDPVRSVLLDRLSTDAKIKISEELVEQSKSPKARVDIDEDWYGGVQL